MTSKPFEFDHLVHALADAHSALQAQAVQAVNISLTLRNWLFGCYIREYEQSGADRSAYGERLMEALAERLQQTGLRRIDARELRRYRQFYLAYPQIRESLSARLPGLQIRETLPPDSKLPSVPQTMLVERLSFSHFVELMQVEDLLQRAFYEAESVRGHWSVRELKRQIATQYFLRSGLSIDPSALSALTRAGSEQAKPQQAIRDPYVFEFLGLKPQEVVTEGQLEGALLDKLQGFPLCIRIRRTDAVRAGRHEQPAFRIAISSAVARTRADRRVPEPGGRRSWRHGTLTPPTPLRTQHSPPGL
ncbi:DUF1016 N-terminal domain-containing protein [Ideonella sp.]|uniref:DUF1016 N-terminal domain-containing protein n=1 Tax=Ideonella sp. TaxID=1929293 RepID=UPI003BB66D2B